MIPVAARLYSTVAALYLSATLATPTTDVVTFDGTAGTSFKFVELNDPVMGGKSTGTWTQDSSKDYGVLDGEVVNVPSLSAPGFIKASADGAFPDLSSAAGGELLLRVRSSTPSYSGFRISFATGTISPTYACSGGGSIPFSRGCFKAKFSVPAGSDFTTVAVPFDSFSDMWSPATGDHTKDCIQDADVCPTAAKLHGIKRFEVWAEGVVGKVHLEVQSITARAPQNEAVTMLSPSVVPLKEALVTPFSSTTTVLASFDGASTKTNFEWLDQNDPVMGGASTSTFVVAPTTRTATFNGTCAIVGFLKAPGFAKATSQAPGLLNDVSAHVNGSLQLRVRSQTPSYTGFKVAFAAQRVPKTSIFGGGSFKAGFEVHGTEWQTVEVPFSAFSYDWSGYTGRCDTKDPGMIPGVQGKQHYCCSAEHPEVCPTAEFLKKITDVEVWAEGVAGDFHLELQYIGAAH